jgi:hypothetical protein
MWIGMPIDTQGQTDEMAKPMLVQCIVQFLLFLTQSQMGMSGILNGFPRTQTSPIQKCAYLESA